MTDEITASFRRFGPLVVDWPHKAESKSYFPPKGYAFLLFQVYYIRVRYFHLVPFLFSIVIETLELVIGDLLEFHTMSFDISGRGLGAAVDRRLHSGRGQALLVRELAHD